MFKKIRAIRNFLGKKVVTYFGFSIGLGIASFAVETSFVFVLQGFLHAIGLIDKSKTFLPDWYPDTLFSAVVLLFLFGFGRVCVGIAKNYSVSLTQYTFLTEQRKKIIAYGLGNAQMLSTKKLISIFTDVTNQSGIAIIGASFFFNTLVASLLYLIVGFRMAPMEMISGILVLLVSLYPIKYSSRMISTHGVNIISSWENISESLLRGLRNYYFLTIYNQVDREIKNGQEQLESYKKSYMHYTFITGFVTHFPLLIGTLTLSLITYISVKYIHTDPIKLVSFLYVFIRLVQSASEVSSAVSGFNLNLPSLKLLYETNVHHDDLIKNKKSKKDLLINSSDIVINAEDVSFGYENNSILFDKLNFSLKKGDIYVIKGESGVGKSTLLSLIAGLYEPTTGKIKINNNDTAEFNIDLHAILAYVGPEPYLINGTVLENLSYGLNHKLAESEIWQVLENVELGYLIRSLPHGLKEPISDIPKLSTGQKQRLSFARAILRKPKLLILDEATANIDVLTENKIIENLNEIFTQCVTIIVTHKNTFDQLATKEIHLGKAVTETAQ